MDVEQAHIYLDSAAGTIRAYFMMNEELEVVCNLLALAKTAGTLKMAMAHARVAGIALVGTIGECDERTVVAEHIKEALAEFQYQARPRPVEPGPTSTAPPAPGRASGRNL